ncbi:MAG: hypothetical protein AAFV33_16250 [Chloroflexota bacterium]
MQDLIDIVEMILFALLLYIGWMQDMYLLTGKPTPALEKPKKKRNLKPKSPKDCPYCQSEHLGGCVYPEIGGVRPWQEVKSKRGRPKTYSSEGYACVNEACDYYQITAETIHALRRDGTRNQCEAVTQWECGACGKKHTAWLGTPQYRLKTCSHKVTLAIHLSMKGMNQADISEVLEHSEKTIQRWLDRGGRHSERLHEEKLTGLALTHIQLDELFTRVRQRGKRTWVWTAIDGQTRLLVARAIGGRKHLSAHELMHQVVKRLADEMMPIFTSDGLNHYYYTLTTHFGQWTVVTGKWKPVWQVAQDLLYGQFRKVKSGYRLKRVYTKILCGTRDQMESGLKGLGFTGKTQTAYVERLNLTLRHIIAALARRTMALAANRQPLRLRVALGAAYYNFCRPHQSLSNPSYRKRTPAMAAGITESPWTVRQFVLHPVY